MWQDSSNDAGSFVWDSHWSVGDNPDSGLVGMDTLDHCAERASRGEDE
jgi:hypothetical protein